METGVHGNHSDNVQKHAEPEGLVENEVAIIQPLPPVENIVRAKHLIPGYVTEKRAQVGTILGQA